MYQNGAGAAEPNTERETADQRFVRFLSEFRARFEQAKKERWTGDIALTLLLNAGNPAAREISFKEKMR